MKAQHIRNLVIAVSVAMMLAGCTRDDRNTLRIATAANMQFAIDEICEAFTEKSGIDCEPVVSSSGKLTAQIMEGAPYDVFVSADLKYPTELFEQGLTASEPQVYALGQLVVWSPGTDTVPSFEVITTDAIKHIAIANPKTAPYGQAAVDYLQRRGIYEEVEHKLVYGESLSQANQFAMTGAAEIGFTSLSVVLSDNLREKGAWLPLDRSGYGPITQGIVVMKGNKARMRDANAFKDFLISIDGKAILDKFGYAVSDQ